MWEKFSNEKKDNSLTFNKLSFDFRDPGGIRTHDPQLRRLLLYPAELPDRSLCRFRSVGQISKVGAKVMNFFGFASGFASYDKVILII